MKVTVKPRGKWLHYFFYSDKLGRGTSKPSGYPDTREGWKLAKAGIQEFIKKETSPLSHRLTDSGQLFSVAYNRYIELQRFKDTTVSNKDLAKDLLIKFIGDKSISDYSREDFTRLNKMMETMKVNEVVLAVNTQAIRTKDLRAIFNYFVLMKWIKENPVIKVQEKKKKPRAIADQDIIEYLKYVRDDRKNINLFNAITFMLLTGWRAGETANLIWKDINLDEEFPHIVSRNKVSGDEELTPLLDPAYKLLCSVTPMKRTGKVFKYKSKDSLRSVYYKYQFDKWKEKRYTLHQLRKTYITQLLRVGVQLDECQDLSRHTNTQIIMDHYREEQKWLLKKLTDKKIKDSKVLRLPEMSTSEETD